MPNANQRPMPPSPGVAIMQPPLNGIGVRLGRLIGRVPVALMIFWAVAINGFTVRLMEAGYSPAGAGVLFGIGPFEAVAFVVASLLMLSGAHASVIGFAQPEDVRDSLNTFGWLEIGVLGLMLVPSSSASWAVLAFYGAVVVWRTNGVSRQAALLVTGLALAALWSSLIVKFAAAPITIFDALLTTGLLGLVSDGFTQSGNVISGPSPHRLIVLTACSSASYVPHVLLAVWATSLFCGGAVRRRLMVALPIAAVGFLAFNTVRLAVMAWSADAYGVAHGPLGANVFDGVMVLGVLLAGSWSAKS